MRRHVLVIAAVGAAGLALLLSSATASRPGVGVKLTATPPPVTSTTTATFNWIVRPGTRRTRCRLRWQALPGTKAKASSLARRRAKFRRCSSPKKWTKLVRGRYTFVLIADGRGTSTRTRYSWKVVPGSAPGVQFSGTFDCYGSTPHCPATPARCTSTISSGIPAALSAARAGSVICLNAGSYGPVRISSVSKASDVIVRPVAGATVTLGSLSINRVTHVRFSGIGGTMNVSGIETDPNGGISTHDTFDHLVVTTGCNEIHKSGSIQHLLFNHNRYDNLGVCGHEGRVQVMGRDSAASSVIISNSHFEGGCSDGVQLVAGGVQVGPGNEFTNIVQRGCTPHSDPVQCVGAPNTTLVGNYFHDNATTFMCGSGFSNFHETGIHVRNNVFADTNYWSMHLAAEQNNLIEHNVMFSQTCLGTQTGNAPSNDTLRNNVWTRSPGITTACEEGGSCSGCSATYNLNPGAAWFGTRSVKGAPVFVRSPASGYYHYQLAPSSPGYHAASDGKSMGIAP